MSAQMFMFSHNDHHQVQLLTSYEFPELRHIIARKETLLSIQEVRYNGDGDKKLLMIIIGVLMIIMGVLVIIVGVLMKIIVVVT